MTMPRFIRLRILLKFLAMFHCFNSGRLQKYRWDVQLRFLHESCAWIVKLRNDGNSELWALVCTGWAALCAYHPLLDAFEYRQLWYFLHVLRAMFKVLNLSEFFGSWANADAITHSNAIAEFINWSTIPIENKNRSKGSCCLSMHFLGNLVLSATLETTILVVVESLGRTFVRL